MRSLSRAPECTRGDVRHAGKLIEEWVGLRFNGVLGIP
jgi:hypothetical protein